MNQTTKETRRRSYDAVLPKRAARCRLILETLGNRELTASEITEELVAAGRIPYFNRNYVAPRLTELKEIGILTTVGRRKATRSDATEAVWARAEPSGPTGQTATAYADNSGQLDAVGWRAVGAYLPGLCDVRFCNSFSWQDSSLHKWIEKQFSAGGDGHE